MNADDYEVLRHSQAQLSAPSMTHPRPRSVVGSKAASGAWQRIISMMPPHRTFIEAFAGGAAVTRFKKPANVTWLVERDPETAAQLRVTMRDRSDVIITEGDCRQAFVNLRTLYGGQDGFCIYFDPPYVRSTRKRQQNYYKHEWTDQEHSDFLDWIKTASCPVLVSGYYSEMYAEALKNWRSIRFGVPTRHGRAIEWLWMNYPEPKVLHDTAHVGESFTDRQRIKRKADRWVKMLEAMGPAERAVILHEIELYKTRNNHE